MNPQSPAPIVPDQYQTPDLRTITRPRRNRQSAKAAGSSFERAIADWLKWRLRDAGIDRRVNRGIKDRGDVGGVKLLRGGEVTIEAKNYGGQFKVTPWLDEVEVERGNADGAIGVVIAKRRGTTDPAQQVAFMTVETLAVLLEAGVTDGRI